MHLPMIARSTPARPTTKAKPPKPPVRVAPAMADDDGPRPFGIPINGYQPRGVE